MKTTIRMIGNALEVEDRIFRGNDFFVQIDDADLVRGDVLLTYARHYHYSHRKQKCPFPCAVCYIPTVSS